MILNKEQCIKIIKLSTEKEFSEILFGLDESIDLYKKKNEFKYKIKDKFSAKNTNKYFELISEFLSSIIILKEHGGESILYKNIDSRGYDGAFIKDIDGFPRIFLSETKSSDLRYEISTKNTISQKIEEAHLNLQEEFEKSSLGEGSGERETDNSNIVINSNLYISKKIGVLSNEQKEKIQEDYKNIRNSRKINNAILNAMARYDDIKNQKAMIIPKYDNALFVATHPENIEEIEEIGDVILLKMEEFYG